MKIVITTNTLNFGGAEVQRVELANALVAKSYDVAILAIQSAGELKTRLDEKVKILSAWTWLGERPDVIITGTTNTEVLRGLVGRLLGAQWITAVHNPLGPGAPALALFARLGLLFSDILVGLSNKHADLIASRWGVSVDANVANAVSDHWFSEHKGYARHARAKAQPQYHLGFLGRLDVEHKGLDRLCDALELAPSEWRLGVGGDGPDMDWLVERVKHGDLKGRVDILGSVSSAEFLTQVGCLVVLSRWEGQPMVILEALAAGVPIVATQESNFDAAEGLEILTSSRPENVISALHRALQLPHSEVTSLAPELSSTRMASDYEGLFTLQKRRGRVISLSRLIRPRSRRLTND